MSSPYVYPTCDHFAERRALLHGIYRYPGQSPWGLPRLNKVHIQCSLAESLTEPDYALGALAALFLVTGQKGKLIYAKKNVAPFAQRQAQPVGAQLQLSRAVQPGFLTTCRRLVLPAGFQANLDHQGDLHIGLPKLVGFPACEGQFDQFEGLRGLQLTFRCLAPKTMSGQQRVSFARAYWGCLQFPTGSYLM